MKVQGYVFSGDADLDGQQMTVQEAESGHSASDFGTVVSVIVEIGCSVLDDHAIRAFRTMKIHFFLMKNCGRAQLIT